MNKQFNDRIRQVLLLVIIILLAVLLITKLYIFLPGLLGGVTLFILCRNMFFTLTENKKWKKGWTAMLFILVSLIIIAIPIYFSVRLLSPTFNNLLHSQDKVLNALHNFSAKVEEYTGLSLFSADNTQALTKKISSFIPTLLNSTLSLLANLLMMFFLFYYLLTNGREIEKYLSRVIPLKQDNIDSLAHETILMIRANALGIPIICIVQGAFAALGYWIFGVENWGMWGFITGVFAFFPLVGTMIIWVPIVISVYATGDSLMATGLTIYSIVVTGNVDYVTRLALLKKIGDVHPMTTVLGVIVGLGLFGFIGLIFGPLLVSYFMILVKIYLNEFTRPHRYMEDLPEAET